jgi:hypothetical protein
MTHSQEFLMIEFEAAIDNLLCVFDKLQGVDYTNDDLDLFGKLQIANLIFSTMCNDIDFDAKTH